MQRKVMFGQVCFFISLFFSFPSKRSCCLPFSSLGQINSKTTKEKTGLFAVFRVDNHISEVRRGVSQLAVCQLMISWHCS